MFFFCARSEIAPGVAIFVLYRENLLLRCIFVLVEFSSELNSNNQSCGIGSAAW